MVDKHHYTLRKPRDTTSRVNRNVNVIPDDGGESLQGHHPSICDCSSVGH